MYSFFAKNKLTIPENRSYGYVMPKLVSKAEEIAARREDLVVDDTAKHDFRMESSSRLSLRFGRERSTYRMLPYTRGQLCRKIGMPPMYFDKLLRSYNPELNALAYTNVNALLKEHHGEMFLRTVDDCLRGVLSPKYCTFDSNEILDVFTSCVGPRKALHPNNLLIQGYVNSIDVLHLRFTMAKPVRTRTDDDLYFGLDLTSSDVGKYALSVRFFVYKRVCTNGLCLCKFDDELYTQPHLGITKDVFHKGLKRSFQSFPNLIVQATDMINAAGIYSLRESPLFNLETNNLKGISYIENMAKYLGVGQESMTSIAELAKDNYGTSLWAYVNAITEWAQRYDFERRKELEVKAGRLLTDFESVMAG